MMNPMWPTIVAVAILMLIALVTITAMRRYEFEQAMKIWQAEVGLLGAIIGMIGSFFFAQVSIERAGDEAKRANETAVTLRHAHAELESDLAVKDERLRAVHLAVDDLGKQLAAAKQWESSLYALLADPEFRKPLAAELTTKELTPQDMKALIDRFSMKSSGVE